MIMNIYIKEHKKIAFALFDYVEKNPRMIEVSMIQWVADNATETVNATKLVKAMIADGAFHPAN
jgi:hypothetical protein